MQSPLHRSHYYYQQSRCAQAIDKMLCAQVSLPGQSPSVRDRLAQDARYLAVGKLLKGLRELYPGHSSGRWCSFPSSARRPTIRPRVWSKRFYYEVWNKGDETVASEILASYFRFRGSLGSDRTGLTEFIDYMRSIRSALTDFECIIDDLIETDTRAAARMRFRGIHRAQFFGVDATGREITWDGAAFFAMEAAIGAPLTSDFRLSSAFAPQSARDVSDPSPGRAASSVDVAGTPIRR
jgi:predicted ester cyclase